MACTPLQNGRGLVGDGRGLVGEGRGGGGGGGGGGGEGVLWWLKSFRKNIFWPWSEKNVVARNCWEILLGFFGQV